MPFLTVKAMEGEADLERLLQALRRRQVSIRSMEARREGDRLVARVEVEEGLSARAALWLKRLPDVEEVVDG